MRLTRLLPAALFLMVVAPAGAEVVTQETPGAGVEASGPEQYPLNYNSLTGLPYPDKAAMDRRNLIVKISNFPPIVRPQSGLNQADLVYEVESESGITRFAAIYRSQVPRHVGSVRSARLLDLELMTMYSAFLAYSGTSIPIQRMLWSSQHVWHAFSPLTGDNCEDAGFCRFEQFGVGYEHTLYLDAEQLYRLTTARGINHGYKARGFAFDEGPDSGGQPLAEVSINWWGEGNALWQYDSGQGRWLRYTDGVAHYDALDGQQLWADNLIVLQVPHAGRPDLFVPGADDESLEVQLWDSGPALVLRDGRWYSGDWLRFSRATTVALQLSHTGSDKPIRLKPGRSWISIVRNLRDVTLSEYLTEFVALEQLTPARG
ncbi:MAG: DUF3048 domain-containing protein [Anaerolineaceae bacterium]|nr:DUF3048 domain-containing protein [Anaerolineaceae bacterium]